MILALRRWLLGVEPDGPPLLADPFFRYEARRYWTPGRYAATGGALVLWTVLVALWLYHGPLSYRGGGGSLWSLPFGWRSWAARR